METLNLIGSICSIISLLIALFLANQVINIKKKITNNSDHNVNQKNIKTESGNVIGNFSKK